jgi:hypothetical protein
MARQGIFLKITISTAIVVIVLAYIVFNSRFLIKGPNIEELNIYDGQIFEEENLIEITGKAYNISFISLNGRQIFIDEENNFNEKLLLTNKINPIEIYTEDKFGKTDIEKLIVIYKNVQKIDLNQQIEELKIDKLEEEFPEEIS